MIKPKTLIIDNKKKTIKLKKILFLIIYYVIFKYF